MGLTGTDTFIALRIMMKLFKVLLLLSATMTFGLSGVEAQSPSLDDQNLMAQQRPAQRTSAGRPASRRPASRRPSSVKPSSVQRRANSTATKKTPTRRPAAQPQVRKRPVARKPKAKGAAQQNFSEVSFSYSIMTDKVSLISAPVTGQIRTRMQSLNAMYTIYRPKRKGRLLYSYGFGGSIGTVTGVAEPFGESAKGTPAFTGYFIPGLDFRRSYRVRLGVFAPIMYRKIGFKFEEPIFEKSEDPISFGLGARYVNSINRKNSITFSYSHQIIWKASNWDISWQYRM